MVGDGWESKLHEGVGSGKSGAGMAVGLPNLVRKLAFSLFRIVPICQFCLIICINTHLFRMTFGNFLSLKILMQLYVVACHYINFVMG